MAALSRGDVAHLASLARIELSEAELDRLSGQLEQIVEAVAAVGEVAAADVPAMSHPMPLVNISRADVVRPGLSATEALSGAPETEQQRFQVPHILQED